MIEAFSAKIQAFRRSSDRNPSPTTTEDLMKPIPRLAEFLSPIGMERTDPKILLRETGEIDEAGNPILEKVVEVGYITEKSGESVKRVPFIVTEQEVRDTRIWVDDYMSRHREIWQHYSGQNKEYQLPNSALIILRLHIIEDRLESQPPQTVLFEN